MFIHCIADLVRVKSERPLLCCAKKSLGTVSSIVPLPDIITVDCLMTISS